MNTASVGADGGALWYLSRGSGLVALVLLSVSVALGIVVSAGLRGRNWSRPVLVSLHRDTSLFVLVALGLHVVTSVAHGWGGLRLVDVVVPFLATEDAFALGVGALSLDLLLATVLTSVARRHISQRAWRGVHWASYLSWPFAIVHTLAMGTDAASAWLLLPTFVCILAVVAASSARVALALTPDEAGGGRLARGE